MFALGPPQWRVARCTVAYEIFSANFAIPPRSPPLKVFFQRRQARLNLHAQCVALQFAT